MEKFLPILNLLMRFRFLRERIMQSVLNPVRLSIALEQIARNMKAEGHETIADNLSKLTLVVYVQLFPTRELMKGAQLIWQIPANARNVKRLSENALSI